jgi:hypothetical protein
MINLFQLEIHAAHICNLNCESCSHFSNSKHKGFVSLQQAEHWISEWSKRVNPNFFRILGGEPTLNPDLVPFLKICRKYFVNSHICLITNGFFLHNHPDLPKILSHLNIDLHLSIHDDSKEYNEKLDSINNLISSWQKQYSFKYCPVTLKNEDGFRNWTKRYHGFGEFVKPFNDKDPKKSWEICPAKKCVQLFDNKLWKCCIVTYLNLQKQKYPNLSSEWDPYLKYKPLDINCSEEELISFTLQKEEDICGMCPSTKISFKKKSPLTN